MANHRDPVPEWLNATYIQNFLRISFKDPDLKIEDLKIEPGSAVGDNYLCQVFRIKFTPICRKIQENFSIIGKLSPETVLLEDIDTDVFKTESKYFEILQPKLAAFIRTKKSAKQFFPECYFIDKSKKIIFLEDLKHKQKLELQPRGKFLTLQQLEIVVDALATMHAASLHIVKETPELINDFSKSWWNGNPPAAIRKLFGNASKAFEKHITKYNISEEWKSCLVGIRERVENGWLKVYEAREGNLNVLNHGDDWQNNMMFHFNDKTAEKVILIDYQSVYYTSFANDLHYLFFSSAEAGVIIEHTDDLLKRYFEKFIEIAPDVPDLSLERIKSEFAEHYYFGYLMLLVLRPFAAAIEPPDMELVMKNGTVQDSGYNNPSYISDIEKLLPVFEKLGVH